MQTIKLINKLGYEFVKKRDTDLYRTLLTKIRNASFDLKCPDCGYPIEIHDVFCSKCGCELDIDWKLYI